MKTIVLFLMGIFLNFIPLQAFDGPEIPLVEQVLYNDQGVFLLIGNSWLHTRGFQVSEAGAFALVSGEWMTLSEAVEFGDFQASWQCSKCKRYNMDGINTCPYCGKQKNA